MMILSFPDLDTLRLAISGAVIPPDVARAAVLAAFDDEGGCHVRPAAALPGASLAELRRLGVQTSRAQPAGAVELSCWPQLLPLERQEVVPAPAAQAPVLFELADPALLPALAGEMLRLGNDRQAFRWLEGPGGDRVLLRVIGPPYYSLLRALEYDGDAAAPRAYTERAPRVWAEVGFGHPLLAHVRPPEGQLLLLRPPRQWTTVPDAPFRDLYEVFDFCLPAAPVAWQDVPRERRLAVPLRLAPGGTDEPAELWVLKERGTEQLDELVRGAGDGLLARLAFAVGEAGGRRAVVLRVRPSRERPPEVVLAGRGFRPYLRLPNLFLPCGLSLQPPLRRDAVRKLLAEDPEQITWLDPHEDGSFTPEHLPDRAFRPLSDWVEYVLDHDGAALDAWVQSTRFDFGRFVCTEEEGPAEVRPAPKREERPPRGRAESTRGAAGSTRAAADSSKPAEAAGTATVPLAERSRREPDELERRLQAAEKQFLDVEGPLDAPGRLALWPQLAALYAALGKQAEAALCWVNALWQEGPGSAEVVEAWARAEAGRAPGGPLAPALERLLARAQPSRDDLRALAALLLLATRQAGPEPALLGRLKEARQLLLAHEGMLPVRAVWLAWLAVAKLAGGDGLALARARDRLLERLYLHGLTAELDLPGFLRYAGSRAGDRFRAFREWLLTLPERVGRWVRAASASYRSPAGPDYDADPADTEAYALLILAFGLARVGEGHECRLLQARARGALGGGDRVHACLLAAFDYRIEQVLGGQQPVGPLPPDLLQAIDGLERFEHYAVQKLREYSHILEPHERTDSRQRFLPQDHLAQKLTALSDLTDRRQVQEKLLRMFQQQGPEAGGREHAAVLVKALELAPRLGQEFALAMLERVPAASDVLAGTTGPGVLQDQARLLQRALYGAAHFGQAGRVRALVDRLRAFLQSLRGQPGSDALKELDALAGEGFRGLRTLGLREEIAVLLHELAGAVTRGRDLAALRREPTWPDTLRALLHVAGAWLYFGKDDEARPFLDEARALLYEGQQPAGLQQAHLACAYATALGQAPAELTLPAVDELLEKLGRVHDQFAVGRRYCAAQLKVVEALVLSVLTEDFALGSQARRWLDDEELLVRRRIHQETSALAA
jgi:hypothetical protein